MNHGSGKGDQIIDNAICLIAVAPRQEPWANVSRSNRQAENHSPCQACQGCTWLSTKAGAQGRRQLLSCARGVVVEAWLLLSDWLIMKINLLSPYLRKLEYRDGVLQLALRDASGHLPCQHGSVWKPIMSNSCVSSSGIVGSPIIWEQQTYSTPSVYPTSSRLLLLHCLFNLLPIPGRKKDQRVPIINTMRILPSLILKLSSRLISQNKKYETYKAVVHRNHCEQWARTPNAVG